MRMHKGSVSVSNFQKCICIYISDIYLFPATIAIHVRWRCCWGDISDICGILWNRSLQHSPFLNRTHAPNLLGLWIPYCGGGRRNAYWEIGAPSLGKLAESREVGSFVSQRAPSPAHSTTSYNAATSQTYTTILWWLKWAVVHTVCLVALL